MDQRFQLENNSRRWCPTLKPKIVLLTCSMDFLKWYQNPYQIIVHQGFRHKSASNLHKEESKKMMTTKCEQKGPIRLLLTDSWELQDIVDWKATKLIFHQNYYLENDFSLLINCCLKKSWWEASTNLMYPLTKIYHLYLYSQNKKKMISIIPWWMLIL